MADPARLDALRRQFAANPRRYFAPLASALRRAGDAQAAAALTRAQLAEYPEHLTGHVILGQALADAGDHDGARLAFERAHAVDPGNTVALEALVVIARHAGDGRAAAHWVARLREADPEHAAAAEPLEAAFEPFELDAFGADDREAFDAGTLEPAAEVFEPHAFAADAASAPTPDARPAPPGDVAPHEVVLHEVVPNEVVPNDTVPNGMVSDEAPPAYDFVDDLLDPVVGLDVPPADPVPTSMREALPELLAGGAVVDDALDGAVAEPDDAAPPPPAAPFVTETMAGLLLAQGHAAQALDVYVQLLAQRPDDERLRARVAALRADAPAGAAELSGAPAAVPTEAPGAAPAPAEAPAAAESDERAARMWRVAFAALPAEPPASPSAPAPGAAEGASEASPHAAHGSAPAVLAPAVPEPAVPEPAGDFERWAADVDRAASDDPTEAAPASGAVAELAVVERAVAERAAVPTAAHPLADDPDEDLAHFNAWLRGLGE